jgi:hypothetical protein
MMVIPSASVKLTRDPGSIGQREEDNDPQWNKIDKVNLNVCFFKKRYLLDGKAECISGEYIGIPRKKREIRPFFGSP